VPYKDSGTAVTDLAGGQVSAMILPLSTAMQMIQGGRLRALAVLSSERDDALPSAPTMRELGYKRMQVATWYAMLAPKGTPAETVKRLNREVNEALKVPSVAKKLTGLGVNLVDAPPQHMADLIKEELKRWPPVVKAAHITAD
jgi:tripartite-type tricarboxylate transporter receptor subunit TctC